MLADLTEKLKGFNKKTISVYSIEKPYSVEHPSKRRDIEVREVTVDPQAIRQRLAEGLSSRRSPTASTPGWSRGFCTPPSR